MDMRSYALVARLLPALDSWPSGMYVVYCKKTKQFFTSIGLDDDVRIMATYGRWLFERSPHVGFIRQQVENAICGNWEDREMIKIFDEDLWAVLIEMATGYIIWSKL